MNGIFEILKGFVLINHFKEEYRMEGGVKIEWCLNCNQFILFDWDTIFMQLASLRCEWYSFNILLVFF